MPLVTWNAGSDGRYWIDVMLGNRRLQVMIDTGLVDPQHHVGFEVEPAFYAFIKQAGQLSLIRYRTRHDASGRLTRSECGLVTAQLVDPLSGQQVGPTVQLYVSCGATAVPSRVGVTFFHRLSGCEVIWDLDQRTWSIRYP